MFNPTSGKSLVKNTDVFTRFDFEIFPIHIQHMFALQEYFNDDDFFAWGDVRLGTSPLAVYSVIYEEGNNWVDMPNRSDEIEERVGFVIKRFIDKHGGYAAVKA